MTLGVLEMTKFQRLVEFESSLSHEFEGALRDLAFALRALNSRLEGLQLQLDSLWDFQP
jgi:hypothetical protein